ncbi:MAG TPA: hypothetical protein VKM55_21150 [Candidatus Lokiarchaeia archaeon]|nr:hypothetical protein [Candidatus Lokiarchaeia archaeon]
MKGAILLGLLVSFIGMMFLPYVFGLISIPTIFSGYSSIINDLPTSLPSLITPAFVPFPNPFSLLGALVSGGMNPNIIGLFYPVPPTNAFLYFLPSMLAWLVGGILAALFSQSAKKGIISAIVLVVIDFLVYLLMNLFAGGTLIGNSSAAIINTADLGTFLGGNIITPVVFGIIGGLIGGFISRFAFGPEEI